MKWIILPLAVIALSVSSCTKDSLPTPEAALSASSNSKLEDSSVDDHGHHNGGDDKGGNVNGGGGQNISAASVPTAVRNAFKSKYASATSIEWKKLSNGTYKAEFWFIGVKYQSIFSAAGNLLKEEHR